jgi:hypothetical protein
LDSLASSSEFAGASSFSSDGPLDPSLRAALEDACRSASLPEAESQSRRSSHARRRFVLQHELPNRAPWKLQTRRGVKRTNGSCLRSSAEPSKTSLSGFDSCSSSSKRCENRPSWCTRN